MRNKAVFHVDESVFVGGLALLDADRFVVAKELVGKSHSISFDLSDVAVLRFILRHATEDKLEAEVGKVINRVMTAAVWFEECAEMLIGEVLAEVGCKALEGTA